MAIYFPPPPQPQSSGSGAPTDAQYVVIALDGTLTDERKLTAGSGVVLTDGGAGGDLTIDANAGGGVGGQPTGTAGLNRIYIAGQNNASVLTTGIPSTGTMRAMPFRCPPRAGTIDQISFYVSIGLAASTGRIALYRAVSASNVYPGARVADSGDISCASTGHKTYGVSASFSPGELLWLAYQQSSSSTLTIRCLPVAGCAVDVLGMEDAWSVATSGVGLSVALAYGAFPATFTAGATPIVATPIPALAARFSA